MTTTIVNRSLLRLRKAEVQHPPEIQLSGRASPFASELLPSTVDEPDSPGWVKLQKLRSM